MHYIYKITNKLNNKIYVGQTNKPNYRWYQHRSYAADGNKHKQYIHRAMAKYDVDNFVFEVIDVGLNQWQIDCLEENYIKTYNSRDKNFGYNIKPGGNTTPHSEETKQKLREATLNQIATQGHPAQGIKWTEGQRANLSAALKALDKEAIYTEEVRQHMSEAHLGIKDTEETKQRKAASAKEAWEKRVDYSDIKCEALGCEVSGKAKYKIIDGIRYCNKHGLRMLRYGRVDILASEDRTSHNKGKQTPEETLKKLRGRTPHNKITFTEEQLAIILSDPRSNKRIAKDLGVTEKVIKRIKKEHSLSN